LFTLACILLNSPIFGDFFKNSPILGYFFRGKRFVPIMKKIGRATFWTIFLNKTHLVTLFPATAQRYRLEYFFSLRVSIAGLPDFS
jgi:hypothetical protein